MPPSKTALIRRAASLEAAVTHAQDAARAVRAKSEQRIIESECRATKLALTQDREAWRVYRRQLGELADFIPYAT